MSKVFGERLKNLRLQSHMTQQQLADIFATTKTTIHAWENDKQEPNITQIVKLCSIFEESADYLLGIEENIELKKYTSTNKVENNYGTINQTNNFHK